jgi:enamine deaminase RidA (YjgF/YER057c/UK114 family)
MNTLTRHDPDGLAAPQGFSHVTTAPAGRIACVSGQVAYDAQGRIVGVGDLAAQTDQVMRNLQTALEAVGCGFGDLLKTTFFVKHLDEEAVRTIRAVRGRWWMAGALPASTMVGVASLARPELLLEVEAWAVVPSAPDMAG